MSRWGMNNGEWDEPDEEYSRGRRTQRRRSDSDTENDSPQSPDTFSPSASNKSFGLVASDDSMPDVVPVQKPWLSKRHLTNGNPSPSQAVHNRFHQWRLQDKLKTGNGAIVVCLNLDVDPPDVVKTQPCAVLEGWIDPRKLGSAKALEAIGKNLCQQFQSLNARIKYKPFLDPSIDETRRFCVNLRKAAKDERLCFYYNGHGVPKPTSSGELWVFNKTYSQYIPVSLYDLQTWLGSPVVYVWDCSAAGNLVTNLLKYAKQRDGAAMTKHGGNPDGSPPHSSAIQLAACLASETLPMSPDMPADMFTSCLTSPIEMALRFYFLHQNPPPDVTMDMLHEVPGDLKDRRTPLGELNWIFTGVTDTIAWTSFSRPIFKKLFRQDLLVAALFRNFLLAERIMRNYHCTPHTVPELPSTATHPLWAAWDRSVEDIIKQLPDLIRASKPQEIKPVEIVEGRAFIPSAFKYEYKSSSFFTDHLTAFELWMSRGGGALTKVGPWSIPPPEKLEDEVLTPDGGEEPTPADLVPRKQPAQLPILLQVLLSQAHRMRALTLLCQFVDLGPWAVHLVLEIGIYPYVQKLLLSPQPDLKPLLIFIWSRLIAFDKSCQVDLLREQQFAYFATILDYANPTGLNYTFEYRSMCSFILASLCRDHPPGQVACLGWNKGALLGFFRHHITTSSDYLLKQWCCLALAQLWDANNEAKEIAVDQVMQNHLLSLLGDDPSAEVRASALYALATFEGASGSANAEVVGGGGTGRMPQLSEEAHLEMELGTAVDAIKITKSDASPIVRKEAVILISALVNEWRGYFVVAAWLYWEEERQSTSSNTSDEIADRALDQWISSLKGKDASKKQHRLFLRKFFLLLTFLYDLVVDPHVEVATLATTVVDFVVAMLLESPFARIQGTSVRRSSATPNLNSRRPHSSGSPGVNVSRQPSMTNITPSTLTAALQPLQRADSAPQVPTRSSFGLMRNSSIASALGQLAGFAMSTHSEANTAPPSPSQSQTSDIELPPGPACNLAKYISPYALSASPESSIVITASSVPRTPSSSSIGPMSPISANGHSYSSTSTETAQLTNRYTPADVVNALIGADLMKFAQRRRGPDGHSSGHKHLYEALDIDRERLNALEDLGLECGANLLQTVPLKSKLYDWALEYYKEPQIRQLDEDEPGSLSYTRQLWRRNRDDEILRKVAVQGEQASRRSWDHPHGGWKLPFAPTRMTFHHFDSHVSVCDEGAHVSVYNWKTASRISGWNNGNPKGTSITSLHFVDEEVGGAVVVGSSDGVVKVYNNYDPAYSDSNPVQLVSGFRALATMSTATRGVGMVTEWNQTLTRLLCSGDSEAVYEWDAMTERCVTTMQTEENCPLTSLATNPHSRRSFIAGFGNGAIKVFDTRARDASTSIRQNRREHRSWITSVRYQPGADKQVLSASVDGVVNLWDLRYTEAVVQTWEVFPEGIQSFDVHPYSDVFVASSSLTRSWRNVSVLMHSFTPVQRRSANGAMHDATTALLNTSFPSGLTAPSRAHPNASNLHFTHSCLAFHPTQMMFALGTADGMLRLHGTQFSKGKSRFVSDNLADMKANVGLGLGFNGRVVDSDGAKIDFPTML